MPNWCANFIEVETTNSDLKAKLNAFAESGETLFATLAPMPAELLKADFPNTDPALAARNVEQYGFATWYEFANETWGVKWDVAREHVTIGGDCEHGFTLQFDTAWNPPIRFLELLSQFDGTVVRGYYAEPGNGFAGLFDSAAGTDTTIEYSAEDFNGDTVNPLLEKLDELFFLTLDFEDDEE